MMDFFEDKVRRVCIRHGNNVGKRIDFNVVTTGNVVTAEVIINGKRTISAGYSRLDDDQIDIEGVKIKVMDKVLELLIIGALQNEIKKI